ncbi:hypothetical protein [Melghirimyces algeriensis]|uniref:Uncharacterized protein n=1 Tax=Melghirimyces algeriensis TaxID=910412 RepID=A0A521F0K8_9BACL|nr:hypothetical protein [Melghirimyces algeriensis]SMO88990.1 hypothetical protein SAMN06264849_11177 [Melghirimyces algeriensis]
MENEIFIHQEKTFYTVLLYRKSKGLRLVEMGVFLVGLLTMIPFFEVRSTPFVLALLGWSVAVMVGIPGIYRVIWQPMYTLYPDRLVIQTLQRREEIPLSKVESAHDLPYIYRVDGKKRFLLVSDSFLESLNTQLELVKRGLNG